VSENLLFQGNLETKLKFWAYHPPTIFVSEICSYSSDTYNFCCYNFFSQRRHWC